MNKIMQDDSNHKNSVEIKLLKPLYDDLSVSCSFYNTIYKENIVFVIKWIIYWIKWLKVLSVIQINDDFNDFKEYYIQN